MVAFVLRNDGSVFSGVGGGFALGFALFVRNIVAFEVLNRIHRFHFNMVDGINFVEIRIRTSIL